MLPLAVTLAPVVSPLPLVLGLAPLLSPLLLPRALLILVFLEDLPPCVLQRGGGEEGRG